MDKLTAVAVLGILLVLIVLFTAWMMKLAPGLLVTWAVAATLAAALMVAVIFLRGRR